MQISNNFNRFYHMILSQVFKKAGHLSFRNWIDTSTGGSLTFLKYENYESIDDLKTIFKLMDINFPMHGDSKASTVDLTSKELSDHISWVLKVVAENGIVLPVVEEEWQRLLGDADIYEVGI